MDNKIQIFEDKRIRTAWNEETEEWYFSVVDEGTKTRGRFYCLGIELLVSSPARQGRQGDGSIVLV